MFTQLFQLNFPRWSMVIDSMRCVAFRLSFMRELYVKMWKIEKQFCGFSECHSSKVVNNHRKPSGWLCVCHLIYFNHNLIRLIVWTVRFSARIRTTSTGRAIDFSNENQAGGAQSSYEVNKLEESKLYNNSPTFLEANVRRSYKFRNIFSYTPSNKSMSESK